MRSKKKQEKTEQTESHSYMPKWISRGLLLAWILFACAVIGVILWRTLRTVETEQPAPIPERTRTFLEGDTVDLSDPSYTYEEMAADLRELCQRYPDRIRVGSAGKSADGREILYADLGAADAPRQFFVSAGIHGRETIPPLIAMNLIESYLLNYNAEDENGKAIADFAGDCMLRVVPMINPDGITLATEGLDAIRSETLREQVRAIYEHDRTEYASYEQYGSLEEYLKYWKSNLNGVDLNRNFPIDVWDKVGTGIPQPSSQKYKGNAAASEPETQAIVRLLSDLKNPMAVISLHSQGSILYWDCGQTGALREENRALMRAVADLTGYKPVADFTFPDASLDDYAALNLKIPSVNIELGKGDILLKPEDTEPIWNQTGGLFRMLVEQQYT